jgi:RNA polymerase sigma factor (sigma-70 family)
MTQMTRASREVPSSLGEPHIDDVAAVYSAYSRSCFAVAVRVVKDREFAEDVVQEAFEAVSRCPDRFDPQRGSLIAWVLMLTHHRAVDFVRRQEGAATFRTRQRALAQLVPEAPTPEHLACIRDDEVRVHVALGKLCAIEEEVIVLAYFEGLSQSGIARQLGIPLGTVKSRTERGMRHLRGFLPREP